MSNLGRYQEIVESAKSAGGVDYLIKQIEENAAAQGTSRNRMEGAAAATLLLVVGAAVGKRIMDRNRSRKERSNAAKEQLKAAIEDETLGDANAEHDVDPDDSDPESPA